MRFIVGLVAVATALCFGSGVAHAAEAGTCASGVTAPFSPQRQPCPLSSAEEVSLQPKDVFKECDKGCPEMVVVPAVAFTMGSPENETGRGNSEGPQYHVTIGHTFAVGRFSVTFDEWDACVSDGGCGGYRPDDQGLGRGRRPVIKVSWNDAQAYLQWLSKKTGHEYRLLSQAEREYVAGAGTTTAFWLGAGITVRQPSNTNSIDTYNDGANGEYPERRSSIESLAANPFGLYDVHGNVWDWVEDCYDDSYKGWPADGFTRPTRDCSGRVLFGTIGGQIASRLWLFRTDRSRFSTVFRYLNGGFRVARSLGR